MPAIVSPRVWWPAPAAAWAKLRQDGPGQAGGWLACHVMLVVAAVERTIFMALNNPVNGQFSDMKGYIERAWHLGTGVPLNKFDAFFPPGTHVLMAPAFAVTQNMHQGLWLNVGLWWVLAMLTVVGVGALAWVLFEHPVAVALSMGFLEAHFTFGLYAGFFLSELPYACAMVWSWTLALRALKDGVRPGLLAWSGVLSGMALTMRPQLAVALVLVPLLLWLARGRGAAVTAGVAWVLALSMPVALALALQTKAWGGPSGLAHNGGFNFYQGHCEVGTVETRSNHGVYIWASPARMQRLQREGRTDVRTVIEGHMAWENDYFFALGLACIKQDGLAHLRRIATNIADFYWATTPWPSGGPAEPVTRAGNQMYCALLGFTVLWALRRGRHRFAERFLLFQQLAALPVAVLIYGDCRFRISHDVFGVVLLAGLLCTRAGLRAPEPDATPLPAPTPPVPPLTAA